MFTCHCSSSSVFFIFFFNDTATTEIYTLSLHDALPISTSPHPTRQFLTESLVDGERSQSKSFSSCARIGRIFSFPASSPLRFNSRSEERRVGKECRSRWSPDHQKKKEGKNRVSK